MISVVDRLLKAAVNDPPVNGDIRAWYDQEIAPLLESADTTIAAALQAGVRAPGLQHAFVAGYRCAVEAVAPARIPTNDLVSFAVTEQGGGHPRNIETRLEQADDGTYRLTGEKTWATLVPLARHAVVIARRGVQDDGRPALTACVVDLDASGVRIQPRDAFPVLPDVPHAVVMFDNIAVEPGAIVPGDAYVTMVRPFRTAEDIHVLAATTGLMLRCAVRAGLPQGVGQALAQGDLLLAIGHDRTLDDPIGHLELAGAMESAAAAWPPLLAALRADDADDGWRQLAHELERDLGVFQVAAKARRRRTERAFETVTSQ